MRVRAAIFIDFDNFFSGLMRADPGSAEVVAGNPQLWLTQMSTRHELDGPRSWLVRRCYLNPSGSYKSADNTYTSFRRFRDLYTQAGFEVIDCPPLTQHLKTAADIRMTLDIVDALASGVHYDEFVIVSSDADFTPVLQRLRAADRRTTLVTTQKAAPAFQAIADQTIDVDALLALVVGDGFDGTPINEARSRFREIVQRLLGEAAEPIKLASVGIAVQAGIGTVGKDTRWFGAVSMSRAIAALALPDVELDSRYLWDRTRHAPPSDPSPPPGPAVPEASAGVPEASAGVPEGVPAPAPGCDRWPDQIPPDGEDGHM